MRRHDTPHDVAIALSRHAPRDIQSLLDPAVGAGNLIAPLLRRLDKSKATVFVVDSDKEAINSVSQSLRKALPQSAKLIHSDFLSWSIQPRRPLFDCIVMNPPFAATKGMLYPFKRPNEGRSSRTIVRYVPLEAAFMSRAIDLLTPKGRLLAIVPCSVVMADNLQWLRNEMLSKGAIRFVHELPPRSFPAVESRMYLLVFDKGVGQRKITFLNHDLHEPEQLRVPLTDYQATRLDFGFVSACEKLDRLSKYGYLKWQKLSELAIVIRGDVASPRGPDCAVHSTDYSSGFWHSSQRHNVSLVVGSGRSVRRGDILMSRVGRNSSRSAGRGIGIEGMACSDCVLLVRPNEIKNALKLRFALRVMLSLDWARPLVERGTGASYISHGSLLKLPIPMGVSERFARQFQLFAKGEKTCSGSQSQRAVSAVAGKIDRLLN